MEIKYFQSFNKALAEYDRLKPGLLAIGCKIDLVTFPLGYGLSVYKDSKQHLLCEDGKFSKEDYSPSY